MSTFTRRATIVAAAVATLTLAMASGAMAASTTIRKGSATADPYGGNVRGSLISATAGFSGGGLSVTCNQSTIEGSVNSDGTAMTVTTVSFSDTRTSDGRCPNSAGGSTSITALNLPYTGGNVTYAPVSGGQDGTMTIAGILVKAVNSTLLGTFTCHYTGTGAGGSGTGPLYNPDNPNRPVTTVAEGQFNANGISAVKVNTAEYPSSGSCPSSGTLSGAYQLQGETSPGVFGQTLYLTA
ncbi:MAG: hypothetical protein ACRDT6_10735 [Micromonosporaceae bacterium]